MNSVILQLAYKYIKLIFVVAAIIALYRGHNYPGGGFIGGLLASLAIIFKGFAYNFSELKKSIKNRPLQFISTGLALAVLSFIPSVISKEPLMKGIWIKPYIPILGELKLGTPLIFDIGVFFVVIGITLLFITSLTNSK